MPELPEVETIVNDLRPQLVGRRFESLQLTRDPAIRARLVRYPSADKFIRRLRGRTINGDLTEAEFERLIRPRRRPVKSALLDQSFLAGVGNIYADEACFRAGIRPSRWTHRLTVRERRALYEAIQHVLENSIAARGSSIINYVDGFGLPGGNQEKLLVYGRSGEPCLRCGTPLQGTRLAGRGTVYCRKCQR